MRKNRKSKRGDKSLEDSDIVTNSAHGYEIGAAEDGAPGQLGTASETGIFHEIFNTTEAAAYVRLGKPTMERFRISGEGPPYCKLGGAVRYRKIDLDAWLESRRVRSTSEG